MTLKTVLSAALASTALLAASPALAQSTGGPTSLSVDARAEIVTSQLDLSIAVGTSANFGAITIPNGTTAGAQCRYDLVVSSATGRDGQISLAEVRNGQSFDSTFPTPSGCQQTGTTEAAYFGILCTPGAPVTVRADWTSAGLPGVSLSPSVSGYIADANIGTVEAIRQNINPVVNTTYTCTESGTSQGAFVVRLGGRVTLDTNAVPNNGDVTVGTITLNATY